MTFLPNGNLSFGSGCGTKAVSFVAWPDVVGSCTFMFGAVDCKPDMNGCDVSIFFYVSEFFIDFSAPFASAAW